MWKNLLLTLTVLACMAGMTFGAEAQSLLINQADVIIAGGSYESIEIGVAKDSKAEIGSAVIPDNTAVNILGDLEIGSGKGCQGSLVIDGNIGVNVDGDLLLGRKENKSAKLVMKDNARLCVRGHFGYDQVGKDGPKNGESEVIIADQAQLRVDGSLLVGGYDTGSGPCKIVQSGDTFVDSGSVLLIATNPVGIGSYIISGGVLEVPRIEVGEGSGKATLHIIGSKIKRIRAETVRFHENSVARFTIDKGGITMMLVESPHNIPDDPSQSKLYIFSGCVFDLGFDSPATEAAIAALPMDDPGRCFDLARASAPGYLRWQKSDFYVDHGVPRHFEPTLSPEDAGLWVIQEKESNKAILQAKYIGKVDN
ncbi:MAG: hypothetical protein JXA52_08035 [Planctomycetes bacterium]|nr:hypothetical protein [Planctomycetota bacterium]